MILLALLFALCFGIFGLIGVCWFLLLMFSGISGTVMLVRAASRRLRRRSSADPPAPSAPLPSAHAVSLPVRPAPR